MPISEEVRVLTPDEQRAVYRRRRVGVAVVAVLLIAGGLAAVSSLSDDADDAAPSSLATTTVLGRPAGPCGVMPSSSRALVAELVMIGVDPANPAAAAQVLDEHPTLGGIFVGGNRTTVLNDPSFRSAAQAAGVFVAIDDEGGRVQRLEEIAGQMPSPRVQAATMSLEAITEMATARGVAMRELGVSVDFAPVVDVTTQADDEIIGDRSYGSTPDAVVRNAGAFAAGLRNAGVLPVLKHFPGHGRASGDSHDGAVSTPPLDELRTSDLVPYRQLAAASPLAVMVGHLDVPGLTEPDTPTSLSPATYRLLREEVPFGGLVFTDDLAGMKSITDRYTPAEAAEAAIAAGADMALLSSELDPTPIIDRLTEAAQSGRIRQLRLDAAWMNVAEMKLALGLTTCDRLVGRTGS